MYTRRDNYGNINMACVGVGGWIWVCGHSPESSWFDRTSPDRTFSTKQAHVMKHLNNLVQTKYTISFSTL